MTRPQTMFAVLALGLTLALSACGSDEPPPQKPATSAAEQPPANAAIAAAEQAAAAAAAKVAEVQKQVEPAVKAAEEKVATAATEATEAAKSAASAAEQKVESAAMATAQAVEKTAHQAQVAMAPETITLKAGNGDVSFPHATHAATIACTTCHGEGTPAAFGLTKETAHPLCKGCHQEQKAGPTSCGGCHKKA